MAEHVQSQQPRKGALAALVTGGSAGLGKEIAAQLLRSGYVVVVIGRNEGRLDAAKEDLLVREGCQQDRILTRACDVACQADVAAMAKWVRDHVGRLDVLVNCVGQSDRGWAKSVSPERFSELLNINVMTSVRCTNELFPLLSESGGSVVNIGSLASKIGSRYLGGYALAKHALAGWTQQLRLESKPAGVHVGLVCPGPIRRPDAGHRYDQVVSGDLPKDAARPGAGAKLKGLSPQIVAKAVVRCIKKRQPEVILPGRVRLLVAIGAAFPRLGDWLVLKFTSGQNEERQP